jgi:Tfp pilus assembly PilM family ATPase
MPQLLALEWDSREIRMAVASLHGRQVVIERAMALPCPEAADATPAAIATGIAARIAEELDARGIGRPEVLVAVGRGSVELRQLQLPAAPEEDLPEMVRFQAAREFNELDERWLLDFVSIDQSADGRRTVLAAAIAPTTIEMIETVCRQAGLHMRRLVLRSCSAASLAAPTQAGAPVELRLLVDLLPGEAELTALLGDKAVFLRTTRLSAEEPSAAELVTNLRLTIAAVRNQWGERKVASVVLCGEGAEQAELAHSLETELGLRAELFNPFSAVTWGPSAPGDRPAHPGRFAPLLGALVTELRQQHHVIDFLHPRRRPPPPSRRKQWILAGSLAAAALVAYFVYGRLDQYLLANEVDRLQQQARTLDAAAERAKKLHARVAEISKWTDGEVVWLDRLLSLSRSFPPPADAMLSQLTVAASQGAGRIEAKGWVRAADVIAALEEGVRAHLGRITSKSSRQDSSVRPYSWRFETSILTGDGTVGGAKSSRGGNRATRFRGLSPSHSATGDHHAGRQEP